MTSEAPGWFTKWRRVLPGGAPPRIYDGGFLLLQLTARRSLRYGGRKRFSPFSCWKGSAWDQGQNWQAMGQVWCALKMIFEVEHQEICPEVWPWVQPNSTPWSIDKSSPILQFRLSLIYNNCTHSQQRQAPLTPTYVGWGAWHRQRAQAGTT